MTKPLYRKSWETLTRAEIGDCIKIRELNDRLRKTLPRTQDMIILMGDLKHEPQALGLVVYAAARAFDAFTEDNDPYGEHDCASFEVKFAGKTHLFMFKIDYYDLNLEYHSPDASNQSVTRRVMTLMYARDR